MTASKDTLISVLRSCHVDETCIRGHTTALTMCARNFSRNRLSSNAPVFTPALQILEREKNGRRGQTEGKETKELPSHVPGLAILILIPLAPDPSLMIVTQGIPPSWASMIPAFRSLVGAGLLVRSIRKLSSNDSRYLLAPRQRDLESESDHGSFYLQPLWANTLALGQAFRVSPNPSRKASGRGGQGVGGTDGKGKRGGGGLGTPGYHTGRYGLAVHMLTC